MRKIVLIAVAILALSACDQKGSDGKVAGKAPSENNTCEVQAKGAATVEELLAEAYRLKSCGLTEEKAVSKLETNQN